MEKISKEKTIKEWIYKAFDGSEFKTEEECKKYEQSALCAIRAAVLLDIPNTTIDYNIVPNSNEENEYRVFHPITEEHIINMNKLFAYYTHETTHFDHKNINTHIIMCISNYDGNCFWYEDNLERLVLSYNNIINEMAK